MPPWPQFFLMKLAVFAKQNVYKRALLYCLFHILFYTRRTITVLTVSAMPGIREYLHNFVICLYRLLYVLYINKLVIGQILSWYLTQVKKNSNPYYILPIPLKFKFYNKNTACSNNHMVLNFVIFGCGIIYIIFVLTSIKRVRCW